MKGTSLILLLILSIFFIKNVQSQVQCGTGAVKCSGKCDSPMYIQGCQSYKSRNECDICEYNYIKKNGQCNFQPNSNSKACAQFDYNGECKKCNNGLFLNPVDKQCIDIKMTGCLQKNYQGCLNCAKQFNLINKNCIPKINGCKDYSVNGTQFSCLQCNDGFQLTKGQCADSSLKIAKQCIYPFVINKQKGICQISNCKIHFQYGCIQCNQGFDLNIQNQCLPTKIPGCIDYISEKQCRLCQETFYQLFKGVCYPYGCLQLSQNLQCANCNNRLGFVLENGKCSIPGCKYAAKEGCSICQDGKTLIRNQCVDESYLDQTICVACPSNYFLNSQNVCQKKQEGCKQYYQNYCVNCLQAYVYDNSNKKCIRRVPGCIYNDQAVCVSCEKYFSYNQKDQRCFIIGCKTYSEVGRCLQCTSIWKLTFDNFCSIDNCLEINENGCNTCVQNYQVNKQGTCSPFDPHCIAKNIYDKCIGCHDGYYVDSTAYCKLAILGCNYVEGLCTSCKSPFIYQKQTSTCIVDGCKKYFFGGCQVCQDGYELRYNSCKLPRCLISNKGRCLQCDPDYIMRVKTNQCINKDEFCYEYNKQGECIECAPKYFMSKLSLQCKAREPGCIYDNQDKCSSCVSPFNPIYGQNKCYLQGCLQHNLDNCKSCKYPFVLTDKKYCAIPNCLKNDDSKCTDCFGGYILEKGLCTTGDQNCVQYNFKSGQCLRCKQGYKVVNNKCQYQDAHCQSFTSKGHCSNCQRLYFLNPLKQCELRDANCQQYTNGYCTKCKPYYYYFDSLCYQNSQGCLQQFSIDKCDKCDDGFVLQAGKCKKAITKLNWNSIDMNFFSSTDSKQKAISEQIFTVGKQTKLNLEPCLQNGYGRLFYSSDVQNTQKVCVSSQIYGWQPKNQFNEFIGVQVPNKQTFYAVDIKCLPNNKLTSFTLQYVDILNSTTFKKGNSYDLVCQAPGVVKTIYFTPVEAFAIRIRVRKGLPNIQIQFYYNNKNYKAIETPKNETIIQQTIRKTISAAQEVLFDHCKDQQLCWFGLQVCQPKSLNGFVIQYDNDSTKGQINSVYIDYSVDGIDYTCYNQCRAVNIGGGNVKLPKPVFGSKMRIHVVDYVGKPNIKVLFDYN